LLALAATVDLCALGPSGLRGLAELSLQKAHYAHDALCAIPGVAPVFDRPFMREFVIRLDARRSVHDVCRALSEAGILAGYPLGQAYPELHDALLVCVTDRRTKSEVDRFAQALRTVMERGSL
jgi:glycine dehydrogenase subunit 1